MPKEQSRFKGVDRDLRDIMNDVVRDTRVISIVQAKDISSKLKNMVDQLQRCQKALNEFLEVLIRISIDKYFLAKIVKSESEAFEKFLYEQLGRNYSYVKINQSNVRRQNYWYDKVDNILKAFKPVFLHLY